MTFTAFLLCAVVWLLSIFIVVRFVTYRIKKRLPPVTYIERDAERYPFHWE
jgi:hypothetical protein